MKTVIVTAEAHANYHLGYFGKKNALGLVHLVPEPSRVQGSSFVPVTGDRKVLDDAKLVVITGGVVTPWTASVGFLANSRNIPVVFTELAYTNEVYAADNVPRFSGISAASPYGAFNLHGYLNNDIDAIEITGHPMLDNLPLHQPILRRVLVVSSEFKADTGVALRASVRKLEAAGYFVEVRTHPREDADLWRGFKLSSEPNLLNDLAASEKVIGVTGTAFAAAAAMYIPTIAIEGSTSEDVLPEYKYLFPYVNVDKLIFEIEKARPLNARAAEFITGPVGNAEEKIMAFWRKHEAELHLTSNLNLNDLF